VVAARFHEADDTEAQCCPDELDASAVRVPQPAGRLPINGARRGRDRGSRSHFTWYGLSH
jgi:hypothetical protein